jgi:ABC-type transport system involved in multi-copper enzyme maturation permease subunit
MPIYKRTYRRFDGRAVGRFRWLIMMKQELRVLADFKIFKALVLLASLHVLFRFLQVLAYDVIAQDPNNPLTPFLLQATALMVNERMFFDFIRIQTPLMFIMLLFAGSGMVCNDFRNNLMEVYFSKPLTWRDYLLGKCLALVTLGLSVTALPAVGLLLLHNLLMPGWDNLMDGLAWGAAALGFSLVIVVPSALAILASSALIRSQGFAAVAIFMLLLAESSIAAILAEMLRNRDYLVISFPMALNRIGQEFFGDTRLLFDLRWEWSMLYVTLFCLGCVAVVAAKVRRAEVAA